MNPAAPSHLLTVRQAAQRLGVSDQRVRQLIASGKLKATVIRIAYRDVTHIPAAAITQRLKEK